MSLWLKALCRSLCVGLIAVGLTACPDEGMNGDGVEEGAEGIEEGAEDTGEAIEEGAEDTGEAIEEGAEDTGGAIEDTTEQ